MRVISNWITTLRKDTFHTGRTAILALLKMFLGSSSDINLSTLKKRRNKAFSFYSSFSRADKNISKDLGAMTLNLKVMLRNRSQNFMLRLSSNRLQIVGRLQSAQLNNFIDVKRAPMIKFVGWEYSSTNRLSGNKLIFTRVHYNVNFGQKRERKMIFCVSECRHVRTS